MSRIVRYDPMNVLQDINKLFEQTFLPVSTYDSDTSRVETGNWIPSVDVKEDATQFKILVDLPGMDKKNIEVCMDKGVLTIQGERSEEKKEDGENYHRTERVVGKFYRRFTLPETANGEKIHANMSKGVLEVIIPKKEIAKPKSIEIQGDE